MIMGKTVIIGQGYVGLPLAIRAVEAGDDVIGLDIDTDRVKSLGAGISFVEDVPDDRLAWALETGRYRPTDDYADAAGFDTCAITVPTPLTDGVPDISHIEQAALQIAPHLRAGCTVILESTTYPGTTETVLRPLLEHASGLSAPDEFFLGYSPERIDPGNPTWHLDNTPKLVSGIDDASLAATMRFYQRFVERLVPVSAPRTAELTKLFENTFRHINIALVNELAIVANQLGVDVREAIGAAATKPFGFMAFDPGPGVGGHCLPIDPSYLSWQVKREVGQRFRFIELANDVNEGMPRYVVQRLAAGLNTRFKPVNGSRILLLGLAYKSNVGDLRESPARAVAELLVAQGADVHAVEPHASQRDTGNVGGVTVVDLTPAELSAADAVVLLTDHDDFDYDMVERHARYIFDTRARCHGEAVERL
ncbi:nucleotide sugar dehydrogenase [Dactylosporangium sp. NBC_01737]|nr:nucleotide sugar dehydrogenase [Dactylosporangium sp. NBC_01737]